MAYGFILEVMSFTEWALMFFLGKAEWFFAYNAICVLKS
jgi:hypothetical protein